MGVKIDLPLSDIVASIACNIDEYNRDGDAPRSTLRQARDLFRALADDIDEALEGESNA